MMHLPQSPVQPLTTRRRPCARPVAESFGLALPVLALLLLLASSRSVQAQDEPPIVLRDPFAWSLEVTEPYRGVADLRHTLHAPAGKHGFIRAQGDRFILPDGTPVRFYGVNVCGISMFAPRDEMILFADRLASMGFNVVRLHFVDRAAPAGILAARERLVDQPNGDPWRIDPTQLDRLFFFIALLKERGIYVTHSLFGYANFMPPDYARRDNRLQREHFPIIVENWEQSFTNPYRIFYPPSVDGFKRYIRQLMTTVNPYTGLSLAQEPAILFTEIGNEQGLTRGYGLSPEGMPEPIRPHYLSLWHQFLLDKYRTNDAFVAAYGRTDGPVVQRRFLPEPGAPELLAKWEPSSPSVKLARTQFRTLVDGRQTDALSVTLAPGSKGFQYAALPLLLTPVEGERLQVKLRIRADRDDRRVTVKLAENRNGVIRNCTNEVEWVLGREAQDMVAQFTVEYGAGRTLLMIGSKQGNVSFDVTEPEIAPQAQTGLGPEHALDHPPAPFLRDLQTIGPQAIHDYYEFLARIEEQSFAHLRQFLRDELQVKGLITGTALHAQSSIYANRQMDLLQIHHYAPPVLVNSGASLDRVPLVSDKPAFFGEVNSVNHPAASAERAVLPAVAAAMQELGGYTIFDYTHGHARPRRTPHGIHVGWDPTFAVMSIPARHLFLRGDLQPSGPTLELRLSQADYIRRLYVNGGIPAKLNLKALFDLDGCNYMLQKIRMSFDDASDRNVIVGSLAATGSILQSSDASVVFDRTDPKRPTLVVNTAKTAGVVGAGAGRTFTCGAVTLKPGANPIDFAAIFATAMDDRPLREARVILISAVGHLASADFPDRHLPPKGKRFTDEMFAKPALIEGVEAKLQLQRPARNWRLFALDKLGQRRDQVAAGALDITFDIHPRHQSLWYELLVDEDSP